MCIAILNVAGSELSCTTLKNCWNNNSNGAGILYPNGEFGMGVYKELKSFDRFYSKYSKLRKKFKDKNLVLHFRISTHGKIDIENCHPFLVNSELGFVHNGIINAAPNSNEYSDTNMFNRHILQRLPKGFLNEPGIISLIEQYIGYGSKLLFLNSKGEYKIINEKAGHWKDGNWYSNETYNACNYYDYGGVRTYFTGKGKHYNGNLFTKEQEFSQCDWCHEARPKNSLRKYYNYYVCRHCVVDFSLDAYEPKQKKESEPKWKFCQNRKEWCANNCTSCKKVEA
jgi:hypothetical protein